MDDYISRQAAIKKLISNLTYMHTFGADRSIDLIEELPSADVPPVVRCKDCKYFDSGTDEDGKPFFKCLGWVYGGTSEDDFCSHGERKDG